MKARFLGLMLAAATMTTGLVAPPAAVAQLSVYQLPFYKFTLTAQEYQALSAFVMRATIPDETRAFLLDQLSQSTQTVGANKVITVSRGTLRGVILIFQDLTMPPEASALFLEKLKAQLNAQDPTKK